MVAALSSSLNPKASSQSAIHQNSKTKRTPLLPSDVDNGVFGHRRPKSREVTSRYLSSTSSTSTNLNSSSSRRSPSPVVSRTVPVTPPNRSQSAERRLRATPRLNTPGGASEMSVAAKVLVTSRRSLSVSFQGESFSLPISKTKPAPATGLSSVRKGTPERRKVATPVREQTDNSKPIDQHRWPGRLRQVSSLTRSLDWTVEKKKLGGSGSVVMALQQSMIVESSKTSLDCRMKVVSDNAKLEKPVQLVADSNSAFGSGFTANPVAPDSENVSARFWKEIDRPGSPVSKNSGLNRTVSSKPIMMKRSLNDSPISSPQGVSASRGFSSPLCGAVRAASPSKLVTSSPSRGLASPSRGLASPSRVRVGVASTLSNNMSNTPSILSFGADIRRTKIGENRDVHTLRLLYNRQLQWCFVNAKTDASLLAQSVTAEKSLYNAWVTTMKLCHSVKSKRMELQLLKQNLKLYYILKGQILYLDNWNLVDSDHSSSLSGAIAALEASTLRLPVVSGARADTQNVKDAICSAVDVMQAMASSICPLLSKVEQVNLLVSELANINKTELALLDQCKDILSTLTTLQVKDCSLRTHTLQRKGLPSNLTTEV